VRGIGRRSTPGQTRSLASSSTIHDASSSSPRCRFTFAGLATARSGCCGECVIGRTQTRASLSRRTVPTTTHGRSWRASVRPCHAPSSAEGGVADGSGRGTAPAGGPLDQSGMSAWPYLGWLEDRRVTGLGSAASQLRAKWRLTPDIRERAPLVVQRDSWSSRATSFSRSIAVHAARAAWMCPSRSEPSVTRARPSCAKAMLFVLLTL